MMLSFLPCLFWQHHDTLALGRQEVADEQALAECAPLVVFSSPQRPSSPSITGEAQAWQDSESNERVKHGCLRFSTDFPSLTLLISPKVRSSFGGSNCHPLWKFICFGLNNFDFLTAKRRSD